MTVNPVAGFVVVIEAKAFANSALIRPEVLGACARENCGFAAGHAIGLV